jgi:phage gp36-like protein
MTTRFDDKDPAATVTVEFDFSRLATAVTIGGSPITIAVVAGTDPGPDLALDGSATVTGAKVFQRVSGGLDGCTYALECTANDGGNVLTLEALLPVIDRPKVSAATPRYLTREGYEQQFGVEELQQLVSDGNDYADAENAAAGIVDGYIAAKYSLPLVSVPGMVLGWVGDITRYRLWDQRAPEEVRRRYEDALSQLRDLAAGRMHLPPGSDGAQPATGDAFIADGYSATRVFTADTLADF